MNLLLQAASSFTCTCESPLKFPDPVPDSVLISSSLILRHGIRTPITHRSHNLTETWICDKEGAFSPRMHIGRTGKYYRRYKRVMPERYSLYPVNCDGGELLVQGMQQHYDLGKAYRGYFIDKHNMLPPYFDSRFVTVRASTVERTIRSATSFMNGLYPPAEPDEHLYISTGTDTKEVFFPDVGYCKDFDEMWDNWTSSEEFKARHKRASELYKPIFEGLEIEDDELNWLFIGDWITSHICSGNEIPEYITEEMFNQSLLDVGYYAWGADMIKPGVAGSAIWRQVLKDIDRFLSLQTIGKFRLYSAHDATIVAMLTSLGISYDYLPPFRSHLGVELWMKNDGTLLMRVVFNGDPQVVWFMDNKDVFEYSLFKGEMKRLGLLSYCLDSFPEHLIK